MTKEAILELVRKVKKLADSGIEGEAISARIKFKILCEKYNLNESDFDSQEESENRYFIFRHQFDKTLLSNIICMILDTPSARCGENNNVLRIKLTLQQYNDVNDAFIYYKDMYDEYSKYLMQAIISRNAIGYIPKPPKQTTPEPLTSEPVNEPVPPPPVEETKSEETNTNTSGSSSSSNSKSSNVPEFDMIKLMKLAVALESNPWRKNAQDKSLISQQTHDIKDQAKYAEARNHTSST
jgi:hypothetical protein